MGQLGYKKLDIDFWHMLLAPAGTPQPIVAKLNAALRAALADAKVQKLFTGGGMVLYPPERADARGGEQAAPDRDQAVGRCDPRQPHHGALTAEPQDRAVARRCSAGPAGPALASAAGPSRGDPKTGDIEAGQNQNHRPAWEGLMLFARALAAVLLAASIFAAAAPRRRTIRSARSR